MRFAVAVFLALALRSFPLAGQGMPEVTVVSGSRADGSETELWLAMLRRRLTDSAWDSVARIRRPRTPEEEAWARLILGEALAWPLAADSLNALFDLPPAREVQVVLGDRGGEDAFTHDSLTIGLDLSRLQQIYGDAASGENRDRVNRFFRHEYVHTLQKRWLVRHPFEPMSFLDVALLDAWAEGLGNYYSLSGRWRSGPEGPSPETVRALAELEPRFVSRMMGLACADSAAAGRLLAGLSSGPFTQKWGALPVALWLLAEEGERPGALHEFAVTGPPAVWALAQRQLRPGLADSLAEARRRSAHCSTPAP